MGDHKLAWILGIVTVVYLIAMILLFWRYRRAMDQLSDKMRELSLIHISEPTRH